MIGPLVAGGYIPKNVAIHVRTIQANSSAGSHYQEFELTKSHVTIAQSALIEFLNWYYTRLPQPESGLKTYDTTAVPTARPAEHVEEIVLEPLPAPAPILQKDEPDWEFRDLSNNRGWLVEAVQIERQARYREDVAERLQSDPWRRRYLRMLEAILGLAERIWGPRGSSQAFITCVFFSLVYAYALFWLNLASGWDNPLGVAAGFKEVAQLGLFQRCLLFGLAVLYPMAVWPIGRWLGFVDKRYQAHQRRRLGYQARQSWRRRYQVTSGAIVAVFFVVACFTAIFIMVRFWTNAEGVLDPPLEMIQEIVTLIILGICLGAGPILGVAWGGWEKTPWRALCLGVAVVVSAGAVAGAFAEAIAGAGAAVIALTLAATIAIVGAASVAVAGAFAFATAFCAAALATAVVATTVAGLINSAAILTIAITSAAAGSVAAMSVRAGVKRANLYAAMIGSFAALALVGFLIERDHIHSLAYFAISMLILPVMNGGLDYTSWWVSRFLGDDLTRGLSGATSTAATLTRSLAHITADLFLALLFFMVMAFVLGFAFESYDLYASLEAVDLMPYAAALRDDPFGAGLWIALMLLTTLIPTVIHFGMVVGAILPTTLLTNAHCRTLARTLSDLGATPPSRQTQAREVWAVTIRDSAKFAAGFRWRMLWGVALTCGLLAALFCGLGLVYKHVFLTKWAYWGGVQGIEAARWLFGHIS